MPDIVTKDGTIEEKTFVCFQKINIFVPLLYNLKNGNSNDKNKRKG